MVDHHVDRPGVQARQRVQLTGTNRSFELDRAHLQCALDDEDPRRLTEVRGRVTVIVAMATSLRGSRTGTKATLCPLSPTSVTVLCRPGGISGEPEPDPIPNSAVKLPSADGTKSQDLEE